MPTAYTLAAAHEQAGEHADAQAHAAHIDGFNMRPALDRADRHRRQAEALRVLDAQDFTRQLLQRTEDEHAYAETST